ncbi:hypothetical protein TrRE_jg5187 [Triparma retinervis]|uniref:Uncharacterized protein n=1 Tax=Triparma retinervis TaxID=2557542 RepID=A0A9W7KT92_9STRA|nr:hypothetical protein TrRE_jg5187 [Triparma retinervis]
MELSRWVCFLLLLPSAVASRTSGEVLLYEFGQSDCKASLFPSTGTVSDLSLTMDPTLVSCINGAVGVESLLDNTHAGPRLRSSGDITAVRNQLVASAEMTLEFWLKPASINNYKATRFMTIGKADYPESDDWVDRCSARPLGHFDLMLWQLEDALRLSYSGLKVAPSVAIEDGDVEDCKEEQVEIFENTNPQHLVITVKDREQKAYVDGATLPFNRKENFFDASYIEAISHLDFFTNEFLHNSEIGTEIQAAPWTGQLYLFAMYDKVLTPEEVQANLAAKLRNSLPSMTDKTVTINEDGESAAGSKWTSDPFSYQAELTFSELATISLAGVISDADVDLVDYPNYNADGSKPRLFVGTLPATGSLFLSDGTPIEAEDVEIIDEVVKFRPPKDQNGAGLVSFTLYGKDGETGERSVEGADATITVNVDSVDDPPVPTEIADETVMVGVDGVNIFTLQGTDVDDAITGASILTFPGAGDLHNIESDGVTFGTKLDSGGGEVDLTSLKVGYRFTGDESNPDDTGFLRDDLFSFKLKDASGVKGVPASVAFRIFTSLVATPTSNAEKFTCVEETAGDVLLRGFDNSTSKRDLKFRIAELPQHGDLYDPFNMVTKLGVGSIVEAVDSCPDPSVAATCYPGVNVKYVGNKDYFNFPEMMFNGSSVDSEWDRFKYNAVVSASTDAKSLPKTQRVKVINKNDRTDMTGPEETVFVYALSSADKSERETFCEVEENKEKKECVYGGVARITGINVKEVDKNVDRVRVSIKSETGNGLVALNLEHLDLANFVDCNYPKPNSDFDKNRPWKCKGDGDLRSETVFVAQPRDLNLLFDGLRYENSVKNSVDNVTITIYDGINGEMGCIPKAEQRVDGSVRGNGCYLTNLTLNILVGGFDPSRDDGKSEKTGFLPFGIVLPYQAMLGMMGGMLVMACCCCSCMKRKWKKRRKRKRKEREEKKQKALQLPEIAGGDLEDGVRENRGKDAGAGFINIAGKGVKGMRGGLEKAQGYGIGGPAVGLALKGVKKGGGGEK